MARHQDSALSGANIEFIEGLYDRYLKDPSSVDPSWRELFEHNRGPGRPIYIELEALGGKGPPAAIAPAPPLPPEAALRSMGLQARVDQTVHAFRLRGHLLARIDPLGRSRAPLGHAADLGMVDTAHFSQQELRQEVDSNEVFPEGRVRLADLIDRLRRTYCGHVGVEFQHLFDSERRRWLMRRMEHSENRAALDLEDQRSILEALTAAEAFESFLHTRYVGAKRFSLDGAESLIPMLHALLEEGGQLGLVEVVIGMAHRGRLNVLANVLGKSPAEVLSEFEGPAEPRRYLSRGDVKYHLGFSSDYTTRARKRIHLSLAFNPSHLEAVDPVVEGRVRAKQDRLVEAARQRVLPLLLHGDAAFIAQGVVAEVLNLSELPGYRTGGTVHVVINNQIGFTTEPTAARSSRYCTTIAQMLDVPVFHVNGDDPEACVHVIRLATEYRQRFQSDVVVDLVCFRRYGHNEGDEPAFTQPRMYELIRPHATGRRLYAEELARRGLVPKEEAEALKRRYLDQLQEAHARVREESQLRGPSAMEGLWRGYLGGRDRDVPEVDTGVERSRLTTLLRRSAEVPAGFNVHPRIARLLEARREMAEGKRPLDWAAGELLALASVLSRGTSVRLTGQDTERGTFSHRHAVLHDTKTGDRYVPLEHLGERQGRFQIYNSPLSELSCLGFEYGYSLDCPDCLVVWEAQFGDFVNSAQVIIDQFIAAGEQKWQRLSGLTLLLPHGYEGQGPEHSSARLERFLELCAGDNLQVCYPTTPAQLFHLLRRQIERHYRKPLVVMSPKSLLRKPEAVSSLDELAAGRFRRVILDGPEIELAGVTRLLLCSGKVYYDLLEGRERRRERSIGLWRVEQLHPFPLEELTRLVAEMTSLAEVVWVQEEPKNMGAWRYIFPLLAELTSSTPRSPSLRFIGRAESSSPATGYHEAHALEQEHIVAEALSWEGAPVTVEERVEH